MKMDVKKHPQRVTNHKLVSCYLPSTLYLLFARLSHFGVRYTALRGRSMTGLS